MKLNKIVRLMLLFSMMCGMVSCQKEIPEEIGSENGESFQNGVKLLLEFSGTDRTEKQFRGADGLLYEEGKIKSLLYAVFKKGEKKHFNYVDFNEPMYTDQSYTILNLRSEWFDTTTEIFALANVDDDLKMKLENETNVQNWRDHTYAVKLNEEAGNNDSRVVDKPVMAGYLNLKGGVSDKISVKMERIYCRIWFSFTWQNHPLADNVTIDEIKISKLHCHSKLFNYNKYIWEDTVGIKNEIKEEYVIKNNDPKQLPFMGRLTTPPFCFNQELNLNFIEKLKHDYNILCRFPWKEGVTDRNRPPVRYYVYSLQRGGTSLEQDPLIEIKYHYEYPQFGTIYKKASAHLYDSEGKKHHGLLRNYTYKLNCVVNTVANSMNLQVSSVPWYENEINDIPPFE